MTTLPLPGRPFALVNGRLAAPGGLCDGRAVVVQSGRIAGLAAPGDLGSEFARVDVGGRLVAPGLIDLHTHGALGRTFNDPEPEAWGLICAANARAGVTSLLATLAPAPWADLLAAFDLGRAWCAERRPGAQVLGLYLESPYINPAQRGALDPAHLRLATDGSPAEMLAYNDVLRVMTIAPELPGGLELVRALSRAGVIPAAGHSAAHDSHVRAAMDLGLRHVTHLWSAMSLTVREGPWRKPGLLEAALTFPGLSAEIIADGKHLPPTLLQLAHKCLGPERLCVVSDATSGAGLPEGARFCMGAMTYEVADGVGMMFDRSCFAGSTTLLNRMLPVLTGEAGLPLADALRMASETPARVLGLDQRKGRLVAGCDADIAVFNADFSVWATLIGGEWLPEEDAIHDAPV